MQRRHGAVPWRFGVRDYDAAAARRPDVPRAWSADQVPATPWDPALGESMRRAGVQIEEELVIEGLLVDLAQTR